MADLQGNKIYAVDFDGTLSQGAPFPEVGTPNAPLFKMLLSEKAADIREDEETYFNYDEEETGAVSWNIEPPTLHAIEK